MLTSICIVYIQSQEPVITGGQGTPACPPGEENRQPEQGVGFTTGSQDVSVDAALSGTRLGRFEF